MAKLTRNQLGALSAAEGLASGNGLVRTTAGWHDEKARLLGYHSFTTVNSLVNRGYLKLWGKGRNAHITDAGLAALAEARDG